MFQAQFVLLLPRSLAMYVLYIRDACQRVGGWTSHLAKAMSLSPFMSPGDHTGVQQHLSRHFVNTTLQSVLWLSNPLCMCGGSILRIICMYPLCVAVLVGQNTCELYDR